MVAFHRAIEEEGARIGEVGDGALEEHLRELYTLKGKQIDLRIDHLLEDQAREIAEELIDFEEQMQLLDYELGLAIYQRARTPVEAAIEGPPAEDARAARFRFDGEFWSDELDDYRFVLEDRCVRRQEGE
jgi:hypothetical protein